MRPLPLAQSAFVLGYSFVFALLVNDLAKTMLIAPRRPARTGHVT
jgi:hypothetical protein